MKKISFLFFVTILISSCTPSYYPSTLNIGLLKNPGDFKARGTVDKASVNFQGIACIRENIIIGASVNVFKLRETTKGSFGNSGGTFNSKGTQFEVSGGYFKPFGRKGIFEILAIGGVADIESNDIFGKMYKVGLQPTLGVTSKNLESSFSLRIVNVSVEESAILDPYETVTSSLFVEPAVTFSLGFERLKISYQLGFSFGSNEAAFENKEFLNTIGLQYNFQSR